MVEGGFQIIPLKTLTTRMMDLIHKQVRKPLESLSQYFRYTQQLYFENPRDTVIDLQITGVDSEQKDQFMMLYKIEKKFLMIVKQDLNTKKASR